MRRYIIILTTLLILLALGVSVFAWRSAQTVQPNIILVVVDTTRADRFSSYGYPRKTTPKIDAFAAKNTRFHNAIASSSWTPPSIASIFTGVYPSAHGVNNHAGRKQTNNKASVLSDNFLTLAEALRDSGYQTAGVTANAWVADYLGFSQGFDKFITIDYSPGSKVTNKGIKFLNQLKKRENPFFLYLHYMDPHMPMKPPERFRKRFKGPPVSRWIPKEMHQRSSLYDAEIAYFDHEFDRVLRYLKKQGLYDDAVIALVSDHGEQLKEYGKAGHGLSLFQEELHVPMVIKGFESSEVVNHTVSTLDLYPTLLTIAGASVPAVNQGVDLNPASGAQPPAGVLSEAPKIGNHKAYVNSRGEKVIVQFAKRFHEVPSRKDIRSTTGVYNTREVLGRDVPINSKMRNLVEERLKQEMMSVVKRSHLIRKKIGETAKVELKPDTVDELRGLGYLN